MRKKIAAAIIVTVDLAGAALLLYHSEAVSEFAKVMLEEIYDRQIKDAENEAERP